MSCLPLTGICRFIVFQQDNLASASAACQLLLAVPGLVKKGSDRGFVAPWHIASI